MTDTESQGTHSIHPSSVPPSFFLSFHKESWSISSVPGTRKTIRQALCPQRLRFSGEGSEFSGWLGLCSEKTVSGLGTTPRWGLQGLRTYLEEEAGGRRGAGMRGSAPGKEAANAKATARRDLGGSVKGWPWEEIGCEERAADEMERWVVQGLRFFSAGQQGGSLALGVSSREGSGKGTPPEWPDVDALGEDGEMGS